MVDLPAVESPTLVVKSLERVTAKEGACEQEGAVAGWRRCTEPRECEADRLRHGHSPELLHIVNSEVEDWEPSSPKAKDVLGTDGYIAPEAYLGWGSEWRWMSS